MKKQYKVLILFLLIPFLGYSNQNDFVHSKQKNINKTYLVNSDVALSIDNSYGNIAVTTWNEDKIELDISIKVSGDNGNWVNQRLNDINISIIAMKNFISAETVLGNYSTKYQGRNTSFEINYTIKIPKNGSVKLNNKYGNINTNDLFSDVAIKCKYGKITLGKLFNKSSIQIEYCANSSIAFLKDGIINAKYSNLKITQTDKLDLVSDYTDVEIIESDAIKYNSKYGKIKINNIKKLDASGNYLTIRIGEVYEYLRLNTRYSSLDIKTINANATIVDIVSEYTGINIGYDSNFVFDFNIVLKYANFKYDTELDFYSKEEVSNSKKYNGFYKKKGIHNLAINSNYGNVSLTKNQ